MRNKRDNLSRMFHLSYDAKSTKDVDLKKDLTWAMLGYDNHAILESPVESTILIESSKIFDDWLTLFEKNFNSRMFYALSEIRQQDEMYVIHAEMNPEVNNPYQETVKKIRAEIIRIKDLSNYKQGQDS